jgi:hypothetical protein
MAAGWVGSPHLRSLEGLRYATSYLWQFYLPRLPFMRDPFDSALDPGRLLSEPVPAWAIWVRTGTGYFGWLSAPLAWPLYHLAAASVGLAVLLAVVAVARGRHRLPAVVRRVVAAGVLTLVGFVGMLHVAELTVMLSIPGERLLQGRYLLPVLPLAVAVLTACLAALGRRAATWALAALATVWLVLTIGGFDAVLRFYAT